MGTAKNYYTGLIFANGHGMHITLNHRGKLTPLTLSTHIQRVDEQWRKALAQGAEQFPIVLDQEAWFGARNDLRVLLPTSPLPTWLGFFMGKSVNPHVTTEEERLELTAIGVAVMHHREEICSWLFPTKT